MEKGSHRELTDGQKKQALQKLLQKKGRIHFADGVEKSDKDNLVSTFADALLSQTHLGGKALNSHAHFILYPGNCLPDGTSFFEIKDDGLYIAVAPQAEDAADRIHYGLAKGIAWQEEKIAEKDPGTIAGVKDGAVTGKYLIGGSGLIEKETAKWTKIHIERRKARREPYDPRAKKLPTGIAHTDGDLSANGRARIASDVKDSTEYWLWKEEYDYVLSDEAMQSKTPGRWFRDICVMCGVSTNMLERLTGTDQSQWSDIQNNGIKNPRQNILKALAIVLAKPMHAGHGKGYVIPAGSLFGLRTIEHEIKGDGKETVVDPAELDRISHAFYAKHYRPQNENATHVLEQLLHISDAYRGGAINRQVLVALNIPASLLHEAIMPYGFNIKYGYESPEYPHIARFFQQGMNLSPVVETLTEINQQHLHIPSDHFDECMESLRYLPKGKKICITKLSSDEAFDFASHHHNKRAGGFLKAYREALHVTAKDVGDVLRVSRQRVLQLENDVDKKIIKLALAKRNPWQLPTDEKGVIRPDVVKYIRNFGRHKDLPSSEGQWLSPEQAVGQNSADEPSVKEGLERLKKEIAAELNKYPGEVYPLVHLVSGHDVLVRCEEGQSPKLYIGDLGPWLQQYGRPKMAAVRPVEAPGKSWIARAAAEGNISMGPGPTL